MAYYGRDFRNVFDANLEPSLYSDPVEENKRWVNDFLSKQRDLTLRLACLNLDKYHRERKDYFYRMIKKRHFIVGDLVMFLLV